MSGTVLIVRVAAGPALAAAPGPTATGVVAEWPLLAAP